MSTCSHGIVSGFCWDDATPEAREWFDVVYRQAYAYAADTECRDAAERFASYAAERDPMNLSDCFLSFLKEAA